MDEEEEEEEKDIVRLAWSSNFLALFSFSCLVQERLMKFRCCCEFEL